ncbi:MAG: hypothetical protein IKC34_02325 [Clostridia bacterium]|nr:hypothetical protein [Clostridia bacterium]
MATFFNQASISFNGYVTNSNVTAGEVIDTLAVTKTAISENYGASDGVVYAVSIVNGGTSPITDITLTDDLGAYTVGDSTVVPLDYIDGSARLYINGVLAPAPTVVPGPPLVFSGINIPAGANALLLYEARTNAYAPLGEGSSINNTVSATSTLPCVEGPIEASATVPVEEFTALSIAKSICPDTVASCEEVNYSFVLQNAGNRAVVATDGVVVSDTFVPALSNITVTFNGTELTEGTDYTYDEATGEFATLPGVITIPAAVFSQNTETGVITTTPGSSLLTVSGTV